MEEDVPFTPQRMALATAALILLAGQVAGLRVMPYPLALAGLAGLNGLVVIAMWRVAVAMRPRG